METSSILQEKMQKSMYKMYAVITLLVICVIYLIYHSQIEKNDIIYTKGIVIVDEDGKERVLIGAPVPKSKDRIRDDYDKAMKAWGNDFPPEYKEWYKTYKHENYGMLILDENGYDRLAIGSPTPDPNIGKRIGLATGIEINDERGFERSGYNLINVNGKNRVVLGLDNDNGTEGMSLILSDEGNTGLTMKSDFGEIFLGKTETKNPYIDEYPFKGFVIKKDSVQKKFNVLKSNK